MKKKPLTYLIHGIELNHFAYGYINAALMSVSEDNPSVKLHLEFFDKETIQKMVDDCNVFFSKHQKLLTSLPNGYTAEQCGYDFWKIRNTGRPSYWDEYEDYRPLVNSSLSLHPVCVYFDHSTGKIIVI